MVNEFVHLIHSVMFILAGVGLILFSATDFIASEATGEIMFIVGGVVIAVGILYWGYANK